MSIYFDDFGLIFHMRCLVSIALLLWWRIDARNMYCKNLCCWFLCCASR